MVIILVNIVIDVEVLTANTYPEHHRHWHFHTFLIGGFVGAAFGAACWLGKPLFAWFMRIAKIKYQPRLWSMMFAGVLGAWLHVLLDSFDHYDVQPFWPYQRNPFWRILNPKHPYGSDETVLHLICAGFWLGAIILYVLALKKKKQ